MATTEASSHHSRSCGSRLSTPGRYARESGYELVDVLTGTRVRLTPPEADLLDKLDLHLSLFLLAGGRLDRRAKVKIFDNVANAIIEQRTGTCQNYLAVRYLSGKGWRAMIKSVAPTPSQIEKI